MTTLARLGAFWTRWCDLTGPAGRADWWTCWTVRTVVTTATLIAVPALGFWPLAAVRAITLIPMFTLTVRRARTVGRAMRAVIIMYALWTASLAGLAVALVWTQMVIDTAGHIVAAPPGPSILALAAILAALAAFAAQCRWALAAPERPA